MPSFNSLIIYLLVITSQKLAHEVFMLKIFLCSRHWARRGSLQHGLQLPSLVPGFNTSECYCSSDFYLCTYKDPGSSGLENVPVLSQNPAVVRAVSAAHTGLFLAHSTLHGLLKPAQTNPHPAHDVRFLHKFTFSVCLHLRASLAYYFKLDSFYSLGTDVL